MKFAASALCLSLLCGSWLASLSSAPAQKRKSTSTKQESAPAPTPQAMDLRGTYTLNDPAAATDTIKKAIEVSAKSMAWPFAGKTRSQLQTTELPPPNCIVIGYTPNEVTIGTDRTGTITTPSNGRPVMWNSCGNRYEVSTKWVNGSLERTLKEEGERRLNTYRLSADRKTLTMRVLGTRTAWPSLKQPLLYELSYRRDAGISNCPTPPLLPCRSGTVTGSRILPPAPTPSPTVTTEDSEPPTLERFDRLSKQDKEKVLEEHGPFYPQEFDQRDYSIRAFVRGNWPVVIDYGLEVDSTVTLTIETANAAFSRVLTGNPKISPSVVTLIDQDGTTKEVNLMRGQAQFTLPPEFGANTQVANVSFRARKNGKGAKEALLRIYALGMGLKEEGPTTVSLRDVKYATASFDAGFPISPYTHRCDPLGELVFDPLAIQTRSREEFSCQFHSLSDFDSHSANFFLDSFQDGVFGARQVLSIRLGAIRRNDWGRFSWNGRDKAGKPSRGQHQLQLRGWMGSVQAASWVFCTPPKTLQVDF